MNQRRGRFKEVFVGRPLASHEAPHQLLPKRLALPVFASDPLSSVAYATEEAMLVLALAGAAAFELVTPISFAVATLLVVVVISYRQTVAAYPDHVALTDESGSLTYRQLNAAANRMGQILLDDSPSFPVVDVVILMDDDVAQADRDHQPITTVDEDPFGTAVEMLAGRHQASAALAAERLEQSGPGADVGPARIQRHDHGLIGFFHHRIVDRVTRTGDK